MVAALEGRGRWPVVGSGRRETREEGKVVRRCAAVYCPAEFDIMRRPCARAVSIATVRPIDRLFRERAREC